MTENPHDAERLDDLDDLEGLPLEEEEPLDDLPLEEPLPAPPPTKARKAKGPKPPKTPDLNDRLLDGKSLDVTAQLLDAEAQSVAAMPGDDFFAGEGSAQQDRPRIRVTTELALVVDAAVEAERADASVYVRGGSLVRVVDSDGATGPLHRAPGAPMIRTGSAPWLRERLSLHAEFFTVRRGKEDEPVETTVQPPMWVATHVQDRGTWPEYRALAGVVTAPTMRRDGGIVQAPGYDGASGILYLPRSTFPGIDEAPSRDDAVRACAELLEVVDDFPLSALGRSGWISLVLTMLARELVVGAVPLFAVDAPTAGSGKGLLVNAAHRIAFGVDAAHMSLPPNDEEMRKQITTCLLSGDPAVLLDNVSHPLGGDSLDAVVTAPVWKVRLLGKNEDSGALVPRVVWMVTGNGLELVGDLARRTLRIRLEPTCENPEERGDYQHPERAGADRFLAWVAQHRARLVTAGLTLLRAWHVAGRPGETKPWGSFESWATTVGACCVWAGLDDPSLGRGTKDAALDPARQALVTVFDAIRRLQGTAGGVTAGDLVRAAHPPPNAPPTGEDALREAIGALVPRFDNAATCARVLGRKLKAGRLLSLPVGEADVPHRLDAIPGRARSVQYRVEPVAGESLKESE